MLGHSNISNETLKMTYICFRYVEPSVRPDDSRYGDNPNRLQRHTQFQVHDGSLRFFVLTINIRLVKVNTYVD